MGANKTHAHFASESITPTRSNAALIHRAILLSGSALSPWATIPEPDAAREEVSQQMACHLDAAGGGRPPKDVTADITECLRSKPLEAIMGVRLPNVRYVLTVSLTITNDRTASMNRLLCCAFSFMPSWGPFLPLDDAPDPEFAMEHTGQGFITKEIMIGMTTTESYNDFNAADIQVRFAKVGLHRINGQTFTLPFAHAVRPGGGAAQSSVAHVRSQRFLLPSERDLLGGAQRVHGLG